ncbi:hypothetical protein [Enterococcus sp.]|uniref:hypothetical protein n=1 Tax=Enterococcus sp. TaxID=35783 RepID=UPI002912D1AE|nr:hypothetical protein [Enterococcus sp.]MDU5333958.1 hypothetical protein [Enterococcus sp.]
MKKMVARSLMLAFGASIFLYSEHVFANTVIYDPLDPHNTITPVPNNDPEPSNSLLDETTEESTVSSQSEDSEAKVILEKTSDSEAQVEQDQGGRLSDKLGLEDSLKQKEKGGNLPVLDPQLAKLAIRQKNHVLMLDEDFFSSINTTALPPDSGGGSGGAPNDFADIAQSAYLLSGVVLYGGEANGNLAARMSDQFA